MKDSAPTGEGSTSPAETPSKRPKMEAAETHADLPAPFVTYSAPELMGRPSSSRARILAAALSPLEKAIFDVPLAEWRTIDRPALAGWRCAVARPVAREELNLFDPTHVVLRRVALHRGPVTELQLDAIVNAASTACLGGGGVDGAVHAAAGPLLLRECATFNGCETGQCRLTKGYNLPARYILHTVGPIGEKPEELRSCYRSIFSLAHKNGLRSIGFCGVSTGVYGYPLIPATCIAVKETLDYMTKHPNVLDLCCFACFKTEEYNAYAKCLSEYADKISNTSSKS